MSHAGGIRSRASSFAPGSLTGDVNRQILTLEDQSKREGVARSQAWLHANSLSAHLTQEDESAVASELQTSHGQSSAPPLTAELKELYNSFQRCLDLRDKYMSVSLQRLGDDPRDYDGVFTGPPTANSTG
ncbi:AMP deaminase, partial [Ceratobasidium sp. 392]